MAPPHILVPFDGSPLADEALAYTFRTFDGPITVLNVVTAVDTATSEGPLLDADTGRLETAQRQAQQRVQNTRDRISGPDVTVDIVVRTGEPDDVILEYLDNHAVDQIVMGSHGGDPSELRRRLLGTVSTAVLGEAPIPVTVVR